MKRIADEDPNHSVITEEEDDRLKKRKNKLEEEEDDDNEIGFVKLNDDLAFEVLKHFDAKTLATAACVNKRWSEMAEDERLWEIICTRHWQNIGCGNRQLRSVVLALGGFRRLHSLYIWPLLKNSSSSSSSSSSIASSSSSSSAVVKPKPNWGKDEVNLSLSLLSIRYYEMMMKRKTSN
ncbi:F-box protein GID2-like [Papaver somniferum]|uniref:F-box protein GID2-like n=1 Tax=Papaver somniferum TaxID=3469 RepID=UPI000E6F84D5|nr:F-box protein GID2-like [Papaver somniferum]XP_026431961.1 F-box protein GID2-like [Papaver somniferum]XP_026431962.1 F-box protein GID2-like [Papaver somniferum]XP_026431963.1 F-box protein GID2-like [Papaver somniferum]